MINSMESKNADYGSELRPDGPELDWTKVGWPPIVDMPAPEIKPKASGAIPGHDDFFDSEDAEFIDFDSMDPFEERFGNETRKKTTKKIVAKKKRIRSTSTVTGNESEGSMTFSSEPEDTSGSEFDSEDTPRSEDNEEDESEDDSSSNEEDSEEDDSEDESGEDDDDREDDDTSGSDDDSDESDDSDDGSDDDDSDDDDSDDDDSDDDDSDDDDSDDDDSDESEDSENSSDEDDEDDETKTPSNQSGPKGSSKSFAKSYSSMTSQGLGQNVNDLKSAASLANSLAQQFVSKSPQGLFPVISATLFGGAMACLPTATQSLMEPSLPQTTSHEQYFKESPYTLQSQPEISSLFSDWSTSTNTLRKMK